jgi:type I restriction enzyme S subunit
MKEGWEIKRLGELVNIKTGKLDSNAMVENGKYPFFTCSREIFAINEFAFDCEAILLAGNNANGDFNVKHYNGKFNAYQRTYVITVNEQNRILYPYLYQQLINHLKKFKEQSLGANTKFLKIGMIQNMSIPLPPLTEQQHIVSILDKTFAAIDKAKANAEQNLRNAKELFESYLQSVFENKGDDWEMKTLGEVLQKTESVDPTKNPTKKFIYLDVSSVNKETKEIENATVLLGKDAPSRARKLVKTNDVIFATVRPTHSRVALITDEYNEQVCSTGYIVLRAKDFLSNNLVYYFLLTINFNKQMEKLQKGASYPAVTDSEVKGILISFPKSLKTQQSIVKKLDALSVETKKLEAIYQQKIKDLEELKKSVLQKAFSGELTTKKNVMV